MFVSSRWLLAAAALAALPVWTAAESAHIYQQANLADYEEDSAMAIEVTASTTGSSTMAYYVVPLTGSAGLNETATARSAIDMSGNLVAVNNTNYNNITDKTTIAYLSCDPLNNSFVDADDMLETLMANAPLAILLYSQAGNCCGLEGTDLPYNTIYTMAYASDAAILLNYTDISPVTHATITGNISSTYQDSDSGGGSSRSAIAMSILYSITGIITVLFLAIIITGAVRAHRYPDRYGPRRAFGARPRQSRARGIARAVLETLPIVKFGDPMPVKPDPAVELESQTSQTSSGTLPEAHVNRDGSAASNLATTDVRVHYENAPRAVGAEAAAEPLAATAATAAAAPSLSDDNDNPGCSICTEDFKVGEDVRVLPCNHRFHPDCVDPWLVNVSGTCPLCRLDLRPKESEDDRPSSAGTQLPLPPPLEVDEAAGAAAAGHAESSHSGEHRHRASRLFDLNRLRHASAEERIEALRRYRTETRSQSAAAAGDDEHGHATLTRRLRERFHIRTHQNS